MSQDTSSTAASALERPRAARTVANPRRLRLGRDGLPMPVARRDEDSRPS